jgi:hypothetical protein
MKALAGNVVGLSSFVVGLSLGEVSEFKAESFSRLLFLPESAKAHWA